MRRFVSISLLLFLAAGVAIGQELTSSVLEGSVADQDGNPIAEAVVTAVGPQGTRTQTTNSAGEYTFLYLPPGTYTVKANADGYSTVIQSDVELFIARRTQLPFLLSKGIQEEVTVTSVAPVVDMKSTSTGASIKVDDFAPYVPLGRNLVSTFSIAPGVTDGGTVGAANQSISGSSGLENAYFVDGVNITNAGYGALGSYSIVYGSLGTGVTYDFLEEVQVKTGGFEAEFGQAGGGVVNSVVRTGTNDFQLDAAWYQTIGSLEGDRENRIITPNVADRVETDRRDLSVSVGGPILEDRLFYFAAYNPITTDEVFQLTNGKNAPYDLDGDGVFDDFFSLGEAVSGGRTPSEVERTRTIDNYAAKLAWYLTPNHRFEGTAFGDPSDGDVGPQAPTSFLRVLTDPVLNPDPNSSATGLEWGGDQFSFKYHGVWTPNFFTEFQYSYKENEFLEVGPGTDFRSFFEEATNSTFGGAGFFEDLKDETDQYSIKFTNVIGPVELKYGYSYEEINWRQPKQYSGPAYMTFLPRLVAGVDIDTDGDGVADTTGTGLIGDGSLALSYTQLMSSTGASVDVTPDGEYNVTRTTFEPSGEFTVAEEKNFFAQASWDALPNLNVKAGARWTEQDLTGAGEFTLPLSTIGGQFTGVGSTDYRPKSYTFEDEIAPRIGLSWDVLSNGRHKLYANWGEYYQRVPSDLAVRQFSNEVGIENELFNDPELTSPVLDGTCVIDSNGDGIYETSVACHSVAGTGAEPGVILDGSQENRDLIEAFGFNFDDVSNGEASKLPYVEEWLLGYSWEINSYTALDVRYINREIGRALEDVQFASNEQIWNEFGVLFYGMGDTNGDGTIAGEFEEVFPGHGFGSFGAYVLANPGANVNSEMFPTPIRDYDSWEVTLNRRMRDGWMAYANYRLAKLEGNYEGSFRNDNGQSDPFITSLYDLPAASIQDDGSVILSDTLAGQYTVGPLNTDRRHILNAFVSKQFDMGLNIGVRMTLQSGQPRFPLFAHPTYSNSGEIPGANPEYWWVGAFDTTGDGEYDTSGVILGPDATNQPTGPQDVNGDGDLDEFLGTITGPRLYSYDVVQRDFFGRNPWTYEFDLRASYDFQLPQGQLTAVLDIFNVFSDTESLGFDDRVELRPGSPNPNYLRANLYQAPRIVRLGVKYSF
jgi:hypothetical protein